MNFRSKQRQMDAEAFFMQKNRRNLNKQEELSFFELFWNWHVLFLVYNAPFPPLLIWGKIFVLEYMFKFLYRLLYKIFFNIKNGWKLINRKRYQLFIFKLNYSDLV
jgi:hypothetical protein